MTDTIILHGGSAFSASRLSRLERTLREVAPGLRLSATHCYVIEVAQPLDAAELARLAELLGATTATRPAAGHEMVVAPRLGTISPWASKATEIARNCGFGGVARIERVVRYLLDGLAGDAAPIAARLHDRMTESVLTSLEATRALFTHVAPRPMQHVELRARGRVAIEEVNSELGLALSPDEIDYLVANFVKADRDPTDVELMMFAQANSEHCRHKIFNAEWTIDGAAESHTLFGMIRATHQAHPQGTVVAYADNAAVIEGAAAGRLIPHADDGTYAYVEGLTHFLAKVETHNHPTAISPFPGAATGSGGEIRDEGATGRGAKPKAGLCGFSVSDLRIPGDVQPWESDYGKPDRIASALDIMIEGPIGAAAFNNEFGRPNLAGYFRTLELPVDGVVRGYHKPIMIAGGIGNISAAHTEKIAFPDGTLLIQLGGPGMLIGLGGGAASSMATGTNTADLDFASVQRGNPEIQRRAQEVIDRCWQMGDANPILAIHDVGAGGISNAMPELADGAGRGARFDLRAMPSEDSGMSPREIWSNEAQERYVLAIAPERLDGFARLCARERCPFAVIGTATAERQLIVDDAHFAERAVDMPMDVLLGKPPRMHRDVCRQPGARQTLALDSIALDEAVRRVLRLPAVGSKGFLITIGDRSVGGLTARDQMVGPWQVPVADVAVTALGYRESKGECFAMGERTPLALIDAPASGRMAVGEALTNLAAAKVSEIGQVKLSANWMAAAGFGGEDAALFDTVRAVGLEFCPELDIAIPVGKDSLSMRTRWQDGAGEKEVVAPLSLIVTAFAPCADIGTTLTPQLRRDADVGETELLLVDLGGGRNRLGGSALAQAFGSIGEVAPDIEASVLKAFFEAMQALRPLVLAYHDRSDGGLFVAVCEMAFAGRVGVSLNLDGLCFDPLMNDVDGIERNPQSVRGRLDDRVLAALFNEELGAVLQIRRGDREKVMSVLRAHDLGACSHLVGTLNGADEIRVWRNARNVFNAPRVVLEQRWSETSYRIAALRDDPDCAREEFESRRDAGDPGLHFHAPGFVDAPTVATAASPRLAVLREQGVNGQVEMAAAFERAGFACVDVHMSDLQSGAVDLAGFKGLVACGGFSYGDVLGAGQGWAKSILFNARLADAFAAFFARTDTFALGVCNGCQMMSHLSSIIPGAVAWPTFARNRSEQFEARFTMVEIPPSPSILMAGMAGWRLPVVVSHGEGKAQLRGATPDVAMRYVDAQGQVASTYPANPNGSPDGIAGVTTADGRFTIMMPHPERVFRRLQMSWVGDMTGEHSPWIAMFRNARRWLD